MSTECLHYKSQFICNIQVLTVMYFTLILKCQLHNTGIIWQSCRWYSQLVYHCLWGLRCSIISHLSSSRQLGIPSVWLLYMAPGHICNTIFHASICQEGQRYLNGLVSIVCAAGIFPRLVLHVLYHCTFACFPLQRILRSLDLLAIVYFKPFLLGRTLLTCISRSTVLHICSGDIFSLLENGHIYRFGSYCCSNPPPQSVPVARVLPHDPCCVTSSTCVGVVLWEEDRS